MKSFSSDTTAGKHRLEGIVMGMVGCWLARTDLYAKELPEAMESLDPLECLEGEWEAGRALARQMHILERFWNFVVEDKTASFLMAVAMTEWKIHSSIGGRITDGQELIRMNRSEVEFFIKKMLGEELAGELRKAGYFKRNAAAIAEGKRNRKLVTGIMER